MIKVGMNISIKRNVRKVGNRVHTFNEPIITGRVEAINEYGAGFIISQDYGLVSFLADEVVAIGA